MPTSILLADDHRMVREALRVLLEREGFAVVAEAATGRDAVALAGRVHPDIAILDYSMPTLNGLDAAIQMRRQAPSIKIVLLTMHNEDQCVLAAFREGIKAFVLKTQAASDLVQAIRAVGRGASVREPGRLGYVDRRVPAAGTPNHRSAHAPRTRGTAAHRRGPADPEDRSGTRAQREDGGDLSHAHHGQARHPRGRWARAVCHPEESGRRLNLRKRSQTWRMPPSSRGHRSE